MVPWAWGMNGALSVLGATLAIFIAMNWGFQVTLLAAVGNVPRRPRRASSRDASHSAKARLSNVLKR